MLQALSCDPIVLFEGVPDLVLTLTILCSGQSSCDQVRSWYHVELRPHLGVKIHKLANPEFVFSHEAPRELTCGRGASNASQVNCVSLASVGVRL